MATGRAAAQPGDFSSIRTLAELLAWRVEQTPQAEAYRQYDSKAARWVSTTWQEAGDRVARWAAALARLAVPPGARIAILLPNGLDAVCIDQAALARACVPVPMHALDNPDSIAFILGDSDASLLVAASDVQWQAIARVGVALPSLRQVVVLRRDLPLSETAGPVPVLSLDEWLAAAPTDGAERGGPRPAPEDLAALVYTSGTTGKPKGVMLTHDNVVSNIKAALQRVASRPDDVFLSFLPLSHTLERTAGYYLPIAAGCCVAFARSTKDLPEDLKTVRPTILVSVPRIYERVYAVLETMVAKSAMNARLFASAQAVGWRRFCRTQGRPAGSALRKTLDALAWPLLDRLVAQPLRRQFGGRLRVAVSGGAPITQQIAHCFLGLGIPILGGYGLTESSPLVSVNALEDNDPATVGRPISGVEVRIGENQELLVRGPNVMRGYWKREEDTARTIVDGWLRTGDQAAIEDGRIRILGRIKEIIVTSTGEKIAPSDLELAVLADSSFEQAYAFGDNRPFIACIVVLSTAYWSQLATRLQLDPQAPESLRSNAARAAVLERIRDLTRGFPHYAQPRVVVPTLEPWTIENTLLTPTLKIKRKNLAAHFAAEIEQIYRH